MDPFDDIVFNDDVDEEDIIEDEMFLFLNPMVRLERRIAINAPYGFEKADAWEGIELLHREKVDEDFGDGDSSQWTY